MTQLHQTEGTLAVDSPAPPQRRIVHQSSGSRHGPITRLISPSDLGQILKPFIFLDLFDAPADSFQGFGLHPHSGIATLTWLIQGASNYEDTTGKSGVLVEGGVEWMRAGRGVWHTGSPLPGRGTRGFQLWVALPPELESAPALSQYIAPQQIPRQGPARVLMGRLGTVEGLIAPPSDMNYLAVTLVRGQRWSYRPPAGHQLAWVALNSGSVAAPTSVGSGEIAVFEDSQQAIDFEAESDCEFVLGSAVRHPYQLAMGSYSVHTNAQSLRDGEAEIRRIGGELRAQGRLR